MIHFRTILSILVTALAAAGQTEVRITGMESKSEGAVISLMGERLAHVRSDPASASRANDAAFLLRQILRRDGYSSAEVDSRILGPRLIQLMVNEGPRLSLGDVTVTGAPAAEVENLAELYARPAVKDRPIGSGSPPFREQDVETGLSYVEQDLQARGYWGAEATLVSREVEPETGVVNPVIDVDRGPLYNIGTAQINSPDGRGVIRTRTSVQPYIGRPATTGNINAMRLAVEEGFTSRGYPDASITMNNVLEGQRFVPVFQINLGTRVRLNEVDVAGLERTSPSRVLSRFDDLEGEWYDEAAMNKRIRGLLATGAFRAVRVDTDQVAPRRIDATLHLEEAKAKEVSLAVGFDTYLGPLFRATYTDRNLWGYLLGFTTGFELSSRGVLGQTRVTDPWLFGSDVAGSARLYALIFGREGYTALETGLELTTKWEFGDHYSLELLAGYSVVNLTDEGLPRSQLGETLYTHPRLRATQALDFRDSAVLPTDGWHLQMPLEVGSAVGDVSTSYARAGLSGGWYHEFNPKYRIGAGGELGVLVPTGDRGDLPIDLRLFNGGARSVRSFPDRELGPSFDGYPVGGESMWNANFELIRSISKTFGVVAFVDAGSLGRDAADLTSAEVELAAGLGLRLELPVGPVRLEYGHNLTQDRGEPSGTFHFAIGAAF